MKTQIKIINAYDIYTLERLCNDSIEKLEDKNYEINNIDVIFGNEHSGEYVAVIIYVF